MALPRRASAENGMNVLIDALPPATNYIDYLTLLEYNLDKESLPLLSQLLQDPHLTTNIGWDLIHLLLPLLPESEGCLLDVAKLGNPREAALKVAESLEELNPPTGSSSEGCLDQTDKDEGVLSNLLEPESSVSASESASEPSLRFKVLANMLSFIHPRIKTQRPSQFLLTSASALSHAFETVVQSNTALEAVSMFVRSVLWAQQSISRPSASATGFENASSPDLHPDPEATMESVASGETEQNVMILRSLLSRCFGKHIDSLPVVAQTSPLAWTDRHMESQGIAKVPLTRQSLCELYKNDGVLQVRETLAQQLMSLADMDLAMPWTDVARFLATDGESQGSLASNAMMQVYQPSKRGLLYLLAMKARAALLDRTEMPFDFSVFPSHRSILDILIHQESLDSLSPALLDSILLLGWAACHSNQNNIEVSDHRTFFEYLNQLNLVSSCAGQPRLRYHFHVYSSTLLHAHPFSQTRLEYIKDTIENCPFPNLKVVAVTWLKNEISFAFNIEKPTYAGVVLFGSKKGEDDLSGNVFKTPAAIITTASSIFASPGDVEDADVELRVPFWIASLNLLYFLCTSQEVFASLDMASLLDNNVALRRFREVGMVELETIAQGYEKLTRVDSPEQDHDARADFFALEDALMRTRASLSRRSRVSTS